MSIYNNYSYNIITHLLINSFVISASIVFDNKSFNFYTAPLIEKSEVYLINFFSKEQADDYYTSIQYEWEKFLEKSTIFDLQDSFKSFGWNKK